MTQSQMYNLFWISPYFFPNFSTILGTYIQPWTWVLLPEFHNPNEIPTNFFNTIGYIIILYVFMTGVK